MVQHTLLNFMRTNNSAIDAVVSVFLLSVVGAVLAIIRAKWDSTLVPWGQAIFNRICAFFFQSPKPYIERHIIRRYATNKYGEVYNHGDGGERLLQEAMNEYIQASGIKFKSARVALKRAPTLSVVVINSWHTAFLQHVQTRDIWQRLNAHVELCIVETKIDPVVGKEGQTDFNALVQHTCEYRLRSWEQAHIDDFIATVWSTTTTPILQQAELDKTKPPLRYYHMLTINYRSLYEIREKKPGTETTTANRPALFDAYSVPLKNSKTFDSMFFPGKEAMLAKLDDFLGVKNSKYKTPGAPNKFDVPGCPRKLGFLLEGLPGMGKTSFARALAEYTGRSVVTGSLNDMHEPEHLFKFLHDLEVNTTIGQVDTITKKKISVDEIVILLEEIDCVKALHQRSTTLTPVLSEEDDEWLSSMDEADHLESDDNNTDCKKTVSKDDTTVLDKKSTVFAKKSRTKAMNSVFTAMFGKKKKHREGKKNKVDIDSFLTALDGVVPSPGRLIVFTTNHPEKLDRALLRPGRVDLQIKFTFMTPEDMAKLICLYFSPDSTNPNFDLLTQKQQQRLRTLPRPMSPAELENECLADGTLEDLLTRLENKT